MLPTPLSLIHISGAEDFDASEDAAEITTDPENYSAVVKALEEKGYEILYDDLAMVPMTTDVYKRQILAAWCGRLK